MTRPQITAAQIITAAERSLTDGRSVPTVEKYRYARIDLADYFDGVAERIFTDAGRAMLELERAIDPVLAATRVGDAEDLLYALPGYVGLDRSPLRSTTARAHLRFAEVVGRLIIDRRLVDVSGHMCAVWEFDGALRRARGALKSAGAKR